MESFWGTLKNELVHHRRYATQTEAKASIQENIEIFYNRQRRQSRIGFIPPALFAESFSEQRWPLETSVSAIDSTPQSCLGLPNQCCCDASMKRSAKDFIGECRCNAAQECLDLNWTQARERWRQWRYEHGAPSRANGAAPLVKSALPIYGRAVRGRLHASALRLDIIPSSVGRRHAQHQKPASRSTMRQNPILWSVSAGRCQGGADVVWRARHN